MVTLKKDDILRATDGGRTIFEDLYPASKEIFSSHDQKGKIKLRDERTASASFKKIFPKVGEPYWMLSDFGADTHLNAIDAYMTEKGITFKQALYQLAEKFGVDYSLKADVNKSKLRFETKKDGDKEGMTTYEEKELSDDELSVMGATVTRAIMEKYHYKALKYYRRVGENKVTICNSTPEYPIFLHDCGNFKKIYKPLEFDKSKRFFYIGNKPKDYINGLEEAKKEYEDRKELFKGYINDKMEEEKALEKAGLTPNKKLPEIIICSGERDAMCIAGLGYIPVWFNSETSKKTNEDLDKLYNIADKVYNVPDKDNTGIAQGRILALDHMSIYTIELPEWIKQYKDARMHPCKDLRDYIELCPDEYEFKKLLYSAQCAKFWDIEYKKGVPSVNIRALSLLYFLKLNGFYKYKDPLSKEIKLIRKEGYIVTEYDPVQIRDFVRESLRSQQVGNLVLEAYINSKKASKQLYDDLETIDIDFDSATEDSRMLFFKNVCVRISAPTDPTKPETAIEILHQPKDNKYVWNTKIIPHDFERLKPSFTYDWHNPTLTINLHNNPSAVMRYLINASRLYWRQELETFGSTAEDPLQADAENKAYEEANRFNLYGPRLETTPQAWAEQAVCFLNKIYVNGYLLHQYKIASNAKAIWAMEWKNTDEGASNGRSGKSLMFSCMKKLGLSNIVTMQGRNKKLTDNNFFMDLVDKSTDVLLIDDARKGFDFDTFYTMITGTVTINPKNEKQFELSYEDAPNIVFTSNFPIPNTDTSTLDRMLFVAFSDYYHAKGDDTDYKEGRKVSDEVGLLFGANYTEEQYNADINFYIDCLIFYLQCLQYGIPPVQPPTEQIIKRAKKGIMGEAMYRWASEYFDKESGNLDICIIRQAAYDDYSRSINRNEEKKTAQGWLKGIKAFIKLADYIETLNPEEHPYIREDGRLSAKATYQGIKKSYELIYLKTTDSNELNTEIKEQFM